MNKGINEFKKGNQPRACVTRRDNGTIVADTTRILNRCEVKYTLHIAKAEMEEPSPLELELAIENLKKTIKLPE